MPTPPRTLGEIATEMLMLGSNATKFGDGSDMVPASYVRQWGQEIAAALASADPPRPAGAEDVTLDRRLREYLWLSHGHRMVYGDDGEMQCGECARFGAVDYKRQPLSELLDALDRVGMERLRALSAPPREDV